MNQPITSYRAAGIFDGERLWRDRCLRIENGLICDITPSHGAVADAQTFDLGDDVLCPGLVDLQVNGGGGVLFNDAPHCDGLAAIAQAHRSLGTAHILPTLITDTPEATHAAIEAVRQAVRSGVPGIAGLHLEGPHFALSRHGAHDASLIRPMEPADLAVLLEAVGTLPALMVTVAPESVTLNQVAALAEAGVVVALGHTDADYDTCVAFAAAGARAVTHLFNAMSPLNHRAPGVVGAALDCGQLSAGLIADGVHVHPAAMRAAWNAKRGPGSLYLVSDAMPCAGTDLSAFELHGRTVTRVGNRLTLGDGTLAGADLSLTRALDVTINDSGVAPQVALAAATRVPATLAGLGASAGTLTVGEPADVIRLGPDFGFKGWLGG